MDFVMRADRVCRSFDNCGVVSRAVHEVDLELGRGDFVSVMGPSGCGKSTLLNLLGGLDVPTSGAIYLDGTRVDELSETRRARLRQTRIGVVFQYFNLISDLNVRDNVELPALLAGNPTTARKASEELLEQLNMTRQATAYPAQLSGGERQRAALARALVNSPDVLLADEPTGSLDSASTRAVLDLFARFNKAGQTIVLVTHDARVATAAQRLLTMRDGRIVDETRLDGVDAADGSQLLELDQ